MLTKSLMLSTFLYASLVSLAALSPIIPDQAYSQAKKSSSAGRKKIITQEGRAKKGSSKTNIDFDAAAIDGERRIPAGVAIGGAKQDNEYDLINLRLRWHPEMVKSTSNLETGKGQ